MFDKTQEAYENFRAILRERTTPIVAWIGSGLSVPANLPTWPMLRDRLCDSLDKKANSSEKEERDRLLGRRDVASEQNNYWIAFQILKKALGNTSYRDSVRAALSSAETACVPPAYHNIWRLGISGVLNLNLDRLVTRAHTEVCRERKLHEFSGSNAGPYVHLLKSQLAFVANLHGVVEDMNSWVFTHDELKGLLNNEGYKRFIQSCLATRTILFIGISADDVATGGHLEQLSEHGIDCGSHFWITDRTDTATDGWAENAGVRVIKYRNVDGKHSELDDFFKDLLAYIPPEHTAAPINPCATPAVDMDLPDPTALVQEGAENIRQKLNSKATRILNTGDHYKYEEYQVFCKKYDQAIYRAWYVTTEPPNNVLMGYTLQEEVASGAFGTVYRAIDEEGQSSAIKVLHERIRNDPEMLQGFRRGVSSMRILSDQNMPGIVPYQHASEIPAFAVMEFIEGPTLRDAVEKRIVGGWNTILRLSVELANIIQRSHHLPERVLHRDIRPSNIMLRNHWHQDDDLEVLVLDFDLSWHRGAPEMSITTGTTANAYLAPEQISRKKNESTRNAAVDSYGLGMTLFFLATRQAPEVMQHQRQDWQDVLENHVLSLPCKLWQSLPHRFFRLVFYATQHVQAERWDMSQILGELERLLDSLINPHRVVSAEMLAEELACRALDHRYKWNPNQLSANYESPTGLTAEIVGNETAGQIAITIEWIQRNEADRAKVTKWIPKASDQAHSVLLKAGWKGMVGTNVGYTVGIKAYIETADLAQQMDKHGRVISKVMRILTFDHA